MPRYRRMLAAPLGALLAPALLVAAGAFAAPTAAAQPSDAAGVTVVKDPSCLIAPGSGPLCADPDTLLDVRIGDVRATQPSLGYDEVYYKLGRYSPEFSKDEINKKFDDWCEANGQQEAASVEPDATLLDSSSFTCAVPIGEETADTIAPMKTVVIGPGGTLYLTDGHHTLTSFAEDLQGGLDTHVRLRVIGNLSGLPEPIFWQVMQDNKWVWLRDPSGNAVAPQDLPKSVGLSNFQDDPYRSLLYFARDIGYSADGAVPFQEFYWGTWVRENYAADVNAWDQNDWAASLALVQKISEAQVALDPSAVVDPVSGYTAAQLSKFDAWNDGEPADGGEWASLSAPYSSSEPGKLAYMTAYRSVR